VFIFTDEVAIKGCALVICEVWHVGNGVENGSMSSFAERSVS
jgi:hypothetical protein